MAGIDAGMVAGGAGRHQAHANRAGREIYVLIFRVGMFILGVAAFAWVRVRLKKMQNQLQRLEDPANQKPAPYEPPLPRG